MLFKSNAVSDVDAALQSLDVLNLSNVGSAGSTGALSAAVSGPPQWAMVNAAVSTPNKLNC